MKKILTFIIVILSLNIKVSAASLCNYTEQTELNSKAANIKVSYELIDDVVGTSDEGYVNYYFKISIVNVTEDFYVVVKNDYNDEENTYYSSDAQDGIITIKWPYSDKVTNFNIQAFTSSKTNCPNEKFKTVYLTTPRFNKYSEREICLDYPDFNYCQKFVTFAEIDDAEFVDKMVKFSESENKGTTDEPITQDDVTIVDKIIEFIDDYKFIILGGIGLIVIGSVVIYRVRTKKQRELGL